MEYQCDTTAIKVECLYGMYCNKNLVKARMQRKKRWLDFAPTKGGHKTNNKDFIDFIIKTGHIVNPFLFVEKIDSNRKMNIIIDGNNRINAIIHFIEKPLHYYNKLIPQEFTDDMKRCLGNMSLRDILECRDLKQFCKTNNFIEFYKVNIDNDNIDLAFENLKDTFHKHRFFDIRVLIIRFENIDDSKIKEIYEGVNRGGVKLTRQEILASTTSFITYNSTELDLYSKIAHHVKLYYDDMDDNEHIRIDRDEPVNLNLFEVLLGFQEYCATQYSFIDHTGDGELDLVFRCYEVVFDNFKEKCNNLNTFMQQLITAWDVIKDIQSYFYNTNINYQSLEKLKLHIKKNSLAMVSLHIYTNTDKIQDAYFISHLKILLLYNELCSMIKNGDDKKRFELYNKIGYATGSRHVFDTCQKILAGTEDLQEPSEEKIVEILTYMNDTHVSPYTHNEKPKKRGKLTKYKSLILCMYYNRNVPMEYLSASKNIEHIVPWSISRWTEGRTIDLDRLGNITLIDERTNKQRGNRPMSPDFIEKNKLYYFNFPSSDDYTGLGITTDNVLKNSRAYNNMCKEREEKYITSIVSSLFKH